MIGISIRVSTLWHVRYWAPYLQLRCQDQKSDTYFLTQQVTSAAFMPSSNSTSHQPTLLKTKFQCFFFQKKVHVKSLFYYVFPWDGLSIYLTCSLKREENLTCPICYVEAIYILYYEKTNCRLELVLICRHSTTIPHRFL